MHFGKKKVNRKRKETLMSIHGVRVVARAPLTLLCSGLKHNAGRKAVHKEDGFHPISPSCWQTMHQAYFSLRP